MSFNFRRFFSLGISFILGAFFCLGGIIGLLLPWSPTLRQSLIDLILDHTLILSLFGLGGVCIGLSLVMYAIFNAGRRYAYLKTGNYSVALDENLIHQYLDSYWKKNFPHHPISYQVSIKKKSIQIMADLSNLQESEQGEFLNKVQEDFTNLFGNVLGYPHEVHLVAHFQTDPSNKTV